MLLEIIPGKDLSPARIALMNRERIKNYGVNTKNFEKYEQESIFFYLSDEASSAAIATTEPEAQIVAFGMLKPLTLTHDGQATAILGIGNIIAVQQGQGYGKQLMAAIKDYLTGHAAIGMGFCFPHIAGFYRNCGYGLDETLADRFRYTDATTGTLIKRDDTVHILYHVPDQTYIESLQQSDKLIHSSVPFW